MDEKKRRIRVDEAVKHVIGDSNRVGTGSDAERAQSFVIAKFVRECFDAGFEPLNMIRMLCAGACFLADNSGVSREQLVEVIRAAKLMPGRELIFDPS